jgi:hypothetical protein
MSMATTILATGLLRENRPMPDCAGGQVTIKMRPVRCTTPELKMGQPLRAAASPSRLVFAEPNAGPATIGVNELDAGFLKRSRLQEAIRCHDYA